MHQFGSLASTASASAIGTTQTTSLYAADLGPSEPLSATLRKRAKPNDRRIAIGHQERLPHGVLRCFIDGPRVCVEVRQGKKVVGRRLSIRPPLEQLRFGEPFPEDVFSAQVREFIGTPWHELDSISVWTVQGLREKGEAEFHLDV